MNLLGSSGSDDLSVSSDSSYAGEVEARSGYGGGGCGCGCGQTSLLPFLLGALLLSTWFLNMQVMQLIVFPILLNSEGRIQGDVARGTGSCPIR